jgi:hypothetical protein
VGQTSRAAELYRTLPRAFWIQAGRGRPTTNRSASGRGIRHPGAGCGRAGLATHTRSRAPHRTACRRACGLPGCGSGRCPPHGRIARRYPPLAAPAGRDVPRRVRASTTVAARSPRRRRSHAAHTSGCRRIPASAAEPPKPVPCRYLRSPRPPPVLLAASHRQPYGQSYVPPAVGLDRNLTQRRAAGWLGQSAAMPQKSGLGLRLGSAASHPDRCQH